MKAKYETFTYQDFLLDEDFRAWLSGTDHIHDLSWEAWFEANPAAKKEAEKARIVYDGFRIKERKVSPVDIDDQWQALKTLISHSDSVPLKANNGRSNQLFSFFNFLVAASIVLICFFVDRYYPRVIPRTQQVTLSTKTNKGQQLDVTLSDGTKVRLNVNSSLRYPQKFSGLVREVTLVGEAFFKVAKNENQPFIIHTGEVITKVLGTAFNINAYPDNKEVTVAVLTGKVSVKTNDKSGAKGKGVCISREEMATFGKMDKALVVSRFDEKEQIGWKDGILYFEKSDFGSTLKKLERWYGVTIQVSSPESMIEDNNWRFSGKFQNKSLDYILNVMSYPDRFSYAIHDKLVYLTPK